MNQKRIEAQALATIFFLEKLNLIKVGQKAWPSLVAEFERVSEKNIQNYEADLFHTDEQLRLMRFRNSTTLLSDMELARARNEERMLISEFVEGIGLRRNLTNQEHGKFRYHLSKNGYNIDDAHSNLEKSHFLSKLLAQEGIAFSKTNQQSKPNVPKQTSAGLDILNQYGYNR